MSRTFQGGMMRYLSMKAASSTCYKDFAGEIKADESTDNGGIEAYAATFDRDPDSYGDIIAKGAFSRTLKEWASSGKPIPLMYGHKGSDDPDMIIGSVKFAAEDERGLKIRADFDDSPKAQRCRALVADGRLSKMSFAYNVRDAGPVEIEKGVTANELRDLDLYEVSIVPIPANQHAEILDSKQEDPNLKSGHVASKSAEDSLRQAADLIEAVLEQLGNDSQGTNEGKSGGGSDGKPAHGEDPKSDNASAKLAQTQKKMHEILERGNHGC
jgi:HK97 family phage prohead protease